MTNKEIKIKHRLAQRRYKKNNLAKVQHSNHLWYLKNKNKINKKRRTENKIKSKLFKQYMKNKNKQGSNLK